MQTPIGASRATSTGLFVHEEWVFFDLRHWYNAVYADTRYVQRHGNMVRKRYPVKLSGMSIVPLGLGTVPVARRVWRGICKVGCGCLCDRVTMMKVIR